MSDPSRTYNRKEKRKALNNADKKPTQKKKRPVKWKWRKDGNGTWHYGQISFSKSGLVMLGLIGFVALYLVLGSMFGEADAVPLKTLEKDLDDSKRELTQAKKTIVRLGIEIDTKETTLENYEREIKNYEIQYKNAKKTEKKAKENYRIASEQVQNIEDIEIEKELKERYDDAVNDTKKIKKKLDRKTIQFDKLQNKIILLKNELVNLEDNLDGLKETIQDTRVSINHSFEKITIITISLSNTCKQLGDSTCPTYSELVPLLDNTNKQVSGKFVPDGNDISRESGIKNHWKWYELKGYLILIVVDPDVQTSQRAKNITIQPTQFEHVDIKSNGYKVGGSTTKTWTNMMVDNSCDNAIVSPELRTIVDTVGYMMYHCNDEYLNRENVTRTR